MSDTATPGRGVAGRVERWLEYVFYSGVELAVLASPALLVLLYWPAYDIDASSIAGLSAIAFGTAWLALFRGGSLPVGEFPRLGDFGSLPLRLGYYSATVFAATWLGGLGWQLSGSLAAAALVPIGATWLAFASFPRLYRILQ